MCRDVNICLKLREPRARGSVTGWFRVARALDSIEAHGSRQRASLCQRSDVPDRTLTDVASVDLVDRDPARPSQARLASFRSVRCQRLGQLPRPFREHRAGAVGCVHGTPWFDSGGRIRRQEVRRRPPLNRSASNLYPVMIVQGHPRHAMRLHDDSPLRAPTSLLALHRPTCLLSC